MHNKNPPGRHLHQRSFGAKNDIILCGHGYCRGSQWMTPWMANAVNSSQRRINRNTQPHLRTFPDEARTQSCGLRGRRAADVGSWKPNKYGPTRPVHVYMLPMEPKKMAAFVDKKEHPGFNQLQEAGDNTCCQAAQRNRLSHNEDSGSIGTCVESTRALILAYMWLRTEKKKLK